MPDAISRRDALRLSIAGLAGGTALPNALRAEDELKPAPAKAGHPFITSASDFTDVSRGNPLPHTLKGEALVAARLTPESWRLEIAADDAATIEKPFDIAKGTALDIPALLKLGEKRSVRFLKAMQCNNIARPLGQGLWEGVLLRDVLQLCGASANARRLYYWGFHNDDDKQIFRSSLAMNQVLDAPPGEMPPFLAYKLNGEAISLERGGPVRMLVPWAHGFKSVKWLQKLVLTNAYAANDTYAEKNNDPESYLKTAAYFDNAKLQKYPADKAIVIRGTAMVGWPGLKRVEYWLRPDPGTNGKLPEDDPAWAKAAWIAAAIDPPPSEWTGLPDGVLPADVWGFTKEGKPKAWPMRYSVANWSLSLKDSKPGRYELRVRTVDLNGQVQPEPRPNQRSGKNLVQCKLIVVE